MDYRVTCICGHQFIVSDETLGAAPAGTIACPACQQRLSPSIQFSPPRREEAPPAGPGDPAAAPDPTTPPNPTPAPEPSKRCPFCGEVILAIARKCKHCGEFLDRAALAFPPGAAPSALAANPRDDPVFALSTSQWDNFWRFLIIFTVFLALTAAFYFLSLRFPQYQSLASALIVLALILSGFVAWFVFLRAKNTRILVRPTRIDIEKGIFGKKVTSLELFRVNDISLHQGLIPRVLGFGTIKLTTTDADSPELLLFQIPRARQVTQYLQTQVPLVARQRGAVYMEK